MTPQTTCVAVGSVMACLANVSSEIVNNPIVQNVGGLSTISVSSVLGGFLWWAFGQLQKKEKAAKSLARENHHLRKHISAAYRVLYKNGYVGDALMPEFSESDSEEKE